MDAILEGCDREGEPIWRLAETSEGPALWDHLADVWKAMQEAIRRGLEAEGALPGGLKLRRKAREMHLKARAAGPARATGLLSAYALAVMEENGSAGVVVTAPTCGACGAVPAVLRHVQETTGCGDRDVLHALATAGIVGNLVKANASISGAEVGCQGEVGVACSMAAGALTEVLGGTPAQVENAAEIGMEHNLGLTCDPIGGLVQVPCIERNAMGAVKAINAARLALQGDGTHKVSLDKVIKTMWRTGADMSSKYKETARGGLAVNIIEC